MAKLTHVMSCIRTRATPNTDTFYAVMIIIRISTYSLFSIIYIFIIFNHLHLHYFESSTSSLFWMIYIFIISIIYIFIIFHHLHLHYFESSEAFFKISSKQWSKAQSQYSSYLKVVSSWKKKTKNSRNVYHNEDRDPSAQSY